ncbi:uncharacterized protein LOC134527977 isoform X4 [Bacillus rossius redtenbacheri]|uniref:uncharacterized protein LOC134527977 isoform X4 n=1 Tax=Bacillus rossius redtenbacheri TaxID=93214 RepID=UPI002FDE68D8
MQEETEDVHVKEEPMMQNPLETVFVTVKEEMETEDVCVKEEPVTADPFKTEIVTVKEEFESEDDADGEWAASCSGTAFVPVEITIEDGQGCKQLGAPTTYAGCAKSNALQCLEEERTENEKNLSTCVEKHDLTAHYGCLFQSALIRTSNLSLENKDKEAIQSRDVKTFLSVGANNNNVIHSGRDDEATTSTSTGSRGPRGKNAQYYRDYRARKRAEQEKDSLNRTSDPSTTADSSTINVAGSVTSKKRKSAAEYQREYRVRKKAKRDNIIIDSLAVIPSISTGGFTTTHQSTIVDQLTTAGPSINPKTTAGPSINPQTTAGSSINPQTTAEPSINPPMTRRKTPAEYQREYRARKKAERESTRAAKTNDGSMEIADENTSNIGDKNARINTQVPYTQFHQHKKVHNYIRTKFTENNCGFAFSICDRLWFKQDLRGLSSDIGHEFRDRILPNVSRESI